MRRPVFYGLSGICILIGLMVVLAHIDWQKPHRDTRCIALRGRDGKSNRLTTEGKRIRHVSSPQPVRGLSKTAERDEEEEREEAFDALTDELIATVAELTVDDVDRFTRAFKSLPLNRRDGCLHRLLNLLPDEKIMLCTGILMDRDMDHAVVRAVFEDVLNRDHAVKKPIFDEIYKDKSHICWDDVEWVFEVTGEKPTE